MEDNKQTVFVKLIPRVAPKDDKDELIESGPKRKGKIMRAPQRLVSEQEFRGEPTFSRADRGFYYKNEFYRDGYLEKAFKFDHLQTENVTPTLDELSKFSKPGGSVATADGEQDDELQTAIDNVSDLQLMSQFHTGDLVTIIEGDLVNAQGVVRKIEGNSVVLQMNDEALGELYMEPKTLSKVFQLGDHVKVVRGKYKDDMGMITQIKDQVATVFSDLSKEQFNVFIKDVQSMADVSITENRPTAYKLHDFVQVGYA